MKITMSFKKPIPKEQINKFMDRTVYNTARITLDMTKGSFPRLTGDLERSSYTLGVKGSNNKYGIGANVSYAKHVWEMPQNTGWTNPSTKAQWYATTFKNKSKPIVMQAIKSAKGGL